MRRSRYCSTRATATGSALALTLALVLAAHAATAQVTTTFDGGAMGWRVTGDNACTWEGDTGHPGGCISVNDLATGPINWAIAPPRYLGSWSGATAAESLTVDYYFENHGSGQLQAPAFTISGPGGSAMSARVYPSELGWTTFTVHLSEGAWTVTSGDWASILANVTSLRLAGEFAVGPELLRIDNVSLNLAPTPVFRPYAVDTFDDGTTGDWSFEDCASSNPGTGGNGEGYARIADTEGTSYAFAPASFLGDWSALDGAGHITLDIRVLSFAGTLQGASEFIRISGAGGVAHAALAAADVPTNPVEWRRLEIPVDSAAWTVDQGTWSGLLQAVEECRIQVEFADGTEVVGLDNFGRGLDGLPVVDDAVTLHDPEIRLGGRLELPEVHNVAFNPSDGELYGLLSESAVEDGLWALSGPEALTLLQSYDRPAHLLFERDGAAFVSEHYDGVVYRFERGAGSSLWVSGFHSGDDDPYGLTVAPPGFSGTSVSPGDLLVTDYGNGGPEEVWAFSPEVGEGEVFVAATTGRRIYDLAAGANGVVYGADNLDGETLTVIAPDGTVTDLPLAQDLGAPLSVVRDPVSDRLYVASQVDTGFAVHRVDPSSGGVELVADGFVELAPCCLELYHDRLWVADTGWGAVYELVLPSLFSDDFESGDTSVWSAVSP